MSSLVDLINRLLIISESSPVQKKQILLLKKEATMLEKKVAELTIEKVILLNRIKAFEMEPQNAAKINNQSICKTNQHFGQELPNYYPLNERELKILINVSMKEEISLKEIALSLSIPEQVVDFYLKELKMQNMVIHSAVTHDGDLWSLSPKGRKYLMKDGLKN